MGEAAYMNEVKRSQNHFLVQYVELQFNQVIEWPENIRYILSKQISVSETCFKNGGVRRITRFLGGYRLTERSYGTYRIVRLEGGFKWK